MIAKLSNRLGLVLLMLTAAGCGARRPAAAPEPPPPDSLLAAPVVVVEPFPHALAWSARPDVPVRTEASTAWVRNPFTRFNVLAVDTPGLLVRCLYCIPALEGWVDREDVVAQAASPAEAAAGTLAEFVLAIRSAAENRQLAELQRVMAADFTFTFGGGGGPADAVSRWHFEGYRSFDRLPPLLDRGLTTRDSVIWTAPPAFIADPEYHGLRTGFRRVGGRWQWLFLVSGD